jgi:polysaccharide biosynthesis/export protein
MSQRKGEIAATGAAGGARALIGILLAVGAVSLGGCGTSLLDEGELRRSLGDPRASAPDLQSGSVASGSASKASGKASKPVQVADASGSVPATARDSGASEPPTGSNGRGGKTTFNGSATDGSASGYAVGALDVLEISVFKVPELSKSVQVAPTGTINLPLIGDMPAAGKTAQQIEQDLTNRLAAKYLNNPQVSVFIKEHNSQTVTVEGAVVRAGVFPIKGKLSLVQVVALAGGLNNDLYEKNITVFSTVRGERVSKVYNIDDVRAGKAADPGLRAGDIVVVDNNTGKVVLNTALKIIPGVASVGAVGAAVAP